MVSECRKALVYTSPPHSKSIGFGDGSESGNEPSRVLAAFADFLAKENTDPYSGWYADQCKELVLQDYEFRLYRMIRTQSYTTELPSNAPKLIWYKDAGEVAIHTHLANPEQDMAIGFRSSTFASGSHTVANQTVSTFYIKESMYTAAADITRISVMRTT